MFFLLRLIKRAASLGIVLVAVAAVGAATTLIVVPQAVTIVTANEGTAADLELNVLAERSSMYAADGSFLTLLAGVENREPISLDEMPQEVIDAILAVEDADFYEHDGVNLRATFRALVENVNAGGIAQGGSTITQQLVKNAILTPEQNLNRKTTEAFYAVRLERQMTKDEILERYLNTVYFGSGAYGVQAAAETYWGYEEASEMGWAEASLLAGIIRNPTRFDPTLNPSDARARRSIVLDRLVDVGHLTQEEADDLEFAVLPAERQEVFSRQPTDYFVREALEQVLNDESILGGDPDNECVPEFTVAIASVESDTGAVRALVGGPEFQRENFNLATQGKRQPGSSMKTLVLAALFEEGYSPADSVRTDRPCTFPNPGGVPNPYVVDAGFGGGGGIRSLAAATYASNNCSFVRLGQVVTNEKVIEVANRLGVDTSDMTPQLSLPLGSFEIVPMEMAGAYATFSNEGVYNEPWYIERIEDSEGNVIYQHRPDGSRAVSTQTARMISQVLEGNVRQGTGRRRAQVPGQVVGGKTGTAQDNTDAWFVGYSDYYTTAVWLGDPNKKERIEFPEWGQRGWSGSGRGGFGGELPAEVWQQYMAEIHEGLPEVAFGEPEPFGGGRYLRAPNEIDFCDLADAGSSTRQTVLVDSNNDGRNDCFIPVTTTTTTTAPPDTQPPDTEQPQPPPQPQPTPTTPQPTIPRPTFPVPTTEPDN